MPARGKVAAAGRPDPRRLNQLGARAARAPRCRRRAGGAPGRAGSPCDGARGRRQGARGLDRMGWTVARRAGAGPARAAAHLDWLARHAGRALAPRKVSPWPLYSKAAWVEYQPRGVAAVVAPWNYPFLLPFLATASALAAGCTVVLKPSEVAPASGELVAELVAEAGLPDGVVQVLHGGPAVGAALVQAGVDVVAVTGSSATGRRVAALAAEALVPVIMELGGKDPMLVLDDGDLRRAARGAVWGACFNAGQSCVAVERVYVVDEVHDRFVGELERAFEGVRAGGGGARDIGPIIHPPQLEVIERQVRDAAPRRSPHGRGRALVRADPADRGRPGHGGDARGDVRAGAAGDARAGRGDRRAVGQRLPVRPARLRVDGRHRPCPPGRLEAARRRGGDQRLPGQLRHAGPGVRRRRRFRLRPPGWRRRPACLLLFEERDPVPPHPSPRAPVVPAPPRPPHLETSDPVALRPLTEPVSGRARGGESLADPLFGMGHGVLARGDRLDGGERGVAVGLLVLEAPGEPA